MAKMKRLTLVLALLSSLVAAAGLCHGLQPLPLDAKLDQIGTLLEVQLEQVRYAEEQADGTMSLTRITAAERLRSAEQLLKREKVALERLKDQLREQNMGSSPARSGQDRDWSGLLAPTLSGIEAKIQEINSLMNRLESLRGDVDVNDSEICSRNRCTALPDPVMPRPIAQSATPQSLQAPAPEPRVSSAPPLPPQPAPPFS